MTFSKTPFGLVAVALLAGCSGSGGDFSSSPPPPPPPPNNAAPSFASASESAVTDENTGGVVFTASATDADGDSLTYSLEGDDAAAFVIDGTSGDVEFAATPDFEAPLDSGFDNTYDLTVRADDGNGGSATQALSITVNDVDTGLGETRYRDVIYSASEAQANVTFATIDPGTGPIDLQMDVYTPPGWDGTQNRPVMIVASGGGFLTFNRSFVEGIARDFARRGYVAASIDYTVLDDFPLTPEELAVAGLRATHDLFAAVRFFRADAEGANQFGVRSDGIFVGGESAGAIMALTAATLDPSDVLPFQELVDFVNDNGGVFGNIGDNLSVSSDVQGALSLSGAVLSLDTIDGNSAPVYAAHEEFDPVVPCDTDQEGFAFTGLVVSGGCDVVQRYLDLGLTAQLYLVPGSAGHVDFEDRERGTIYDNAALLFFATVLSGT